jgi:hypothetical protein
MAAKLVISLDFEMFWGVAETQTIKGYGRNVEGVWRAIPSILDLFRRYQVKATWATVGMLMCRDYKQWCELRPSMLPGYQRQECSTYLLAKSAKEYPSLFFARPLVERVLEAPGQELASHSYSHFFCAEKGATSEQFAIDLLSAKSIGMELGVEYRSFVFPRNQVVPDFIEELRAAGIQVYRGNPVHRLYDVGHLAELSFLKRGLRFADSFVPLSGQQVSIPHISHGLVNCPASFFLRPCSARMPLLDSLRMWRLKAAMAHAAISGAVFHLWWHPHNFGLSTEQNIAFLEELLKFHRELHDSFGMTSSCMRDFAEPLLSYDRDKLG